jgi:hypothetical protein
MNLKSTFTALALLSAALLLSFTSALAVPAAEMPVDSSAGTWKLNLEKSTFGSQKLPPTRCARARWSASCAG